MQFKANLITYNGVYKSIETEKLNVPTSQGRRTILSNHMPIMLNLEIGIMETCLDNEFSHYAINGGILYFKNNEAQLVLNNVIDVKEIVVEDVLKEIEKVQGKIENARNENERIRFKYQLEVAENQLKAVEMFNKN